VRFICEFFFFLLLFFVKVKKKFLFKHVIVDPQSKNMCGNYLDMLEKKTYKTSFNDVLIALFLPPGKIHLYKNSTFQDEGGCSAKHTQYVAVVTQGRRLITQGVFPGDIQIDVLCRELALQINNNSNLDKFHAYGGFSEFAAFLF
jgi:hypothetical protein